MIKNSFLVLFIVFSINLFSQDSTFIKSLYAGSKLVIPNGEQWTLEKVFISEENAYNIQIDKSNFLNNYTSKDTLMVPYYITEMELLSNKSMTLYYFYFSK